jgi:hypothetical protein
MLTPHELYVKKIIPYLKGIFAVKLYEKGYTQSEIARILGVTQSAVSQYLDKDETYYIKLLDEIGLEKEFYQHRLKQALSQKVDPENTLYFFMDLWNILMNQEILCRIHRKFYNLIDVCSVYKKISYGQTVQDRQSILYELERAYNILVKLPGFNQLIPEVYSNIARSVANPKKLDDIAAYPGRIIPYRGSIKIVAKPSFGASTHLGEVLIRLSRYYPEIQAVMNIRFDEKIFQAVQSIGEKYIFTSEDVKDNEEAVIIDIIHSLVKYGFSPIVFDKGGVGIEPNTYIFGRDAYDVIDKVVGILWGLRNIE